MSVACIKISQLFGVQSGIPSLSENATVLFTSPLVAEAISVVARSFGMQPRTKYHDYRRTVGFHSGRDLKRIGLTTQIGTTEKLDETSDERLMFEVLNEILGARPHYVLLL